MTTSTVGKMAARRHRASAACLVAVWIVVVAGCSQGDAPSASSYLTWWALAPTARSPNSPRGTRARTGHGRPPGCGSGARTERRDGDGGRAGAGDAAGGEGAPVERGTGRDVARRAANGSAVSPVQSLRTTSADLSGGRIANAARSSPRVARRHSRERGACGRFTRARSSPDPVDAGVVVTRARPREMPLPDLQHRAVQRDGLPRPLLAVRRA